MAFIVQLTNPLNEVQRFPIKAEVLDTQGLRSLLMLCVKRVSMTFFFVHLGKEKQRKKIRILTSDQMGLAQDRKR